MAGAHGHFAVVSNGQEDAFHGGPDLQAQHLFGEAHRVVTVLGERVLVSTDHPGSSLLHALPEAARVGREVVYGFSNGRCGSVVQ